MRLRDRIVELRRVPACELKLHPHNWRTHPPAQQQAVQSVLQQIGYADALLARQTEEGDLELIDGHLRAELTPDETVPVLVVDLDAAEAAALLAVHDPLAAMAGVASDQLAELLAETDQQNAEFQSTLAEVLNQVDNSSPSESMAAVPEIDAPEIHQVIVECQDEQEQQSVYEQMTQLGYPCRVISL